MYSERELDDLKAIQKKYSIDNERFVKGISFCESIIDGESINGAYASVFAISEEEASRVSSNMKRAKWVQELLIQLTPSPEMQYFEHKQEIVRANMRTIASKHSEPKDVASASKALEVYMKSPAHREEEDSSMSAAQELLGSFVDGLKQLSGQNKMVAPNGNIIDVGIME